ncbi:tRNA (adenosine(37)-N6)-threonylcarbamoyltransferase complex ATPase subunit type 1 TsaE [Acanthopleuribacter pedis]|uniref:tRNA threonylcarbamoyladenosine biosynthesis protein TsaE n=1 Tax=Acanthopleuribacter pedis TaxID=442870 RepID=A0A8J7Q6N9_9BACT|nr:tRNA (adenosine(37)-N6)-threonylcarbamoyltransferase complex ATPase subunit type 1 TsaE [Acanthopleuribacter pedis]MBO1319171.1 tRNA (adenosine(37)-N6)-threonylcarbamoyltransferase complex ATPase subunit type 1 TsaE [Acanthopleuribacter pedis]
MIFPFVKQTKNDAETRAVAALFAAEVSAGQVILLQGDLGAGKTTFVRGFCEGLEPDKAWEVDSPTYTIVNHYPIGPGIDHIDLYRLEGPEALESIDLDGILASDTLTFIEWPERLADYGLTKVHFLIKIEQSRPSIRDIRILKLPQNAIQTV